MTESIVFSIFLIFTGAAILSTIALYTRQSLLVVYILLGVLLGPWGLKLVNDGETVKQIGEVGIIFLLFLLGLHLHPQNLLHMLRKVTIIGLLSSIVFGSAGFLIAWLFSFTITESAIVGVAVMFSSTIIGLKLLPTTVMHHQHTGELMISILLFQDLLAIIVLLLIHGAQNGSLSLHEFSLVFIALPVLLGFAFLFERYVLVPLLSRFDRIREYVFLLAIGWCLGITQLAQVVGLSHEVGAFIAGISVATSPISRYIAESLKPLRDFFLVMFFFAIGASFDLGYLSVVLVPAVVLAVVILLLKPFLYSLLLARNGEQEDVALEVGVRLGQASEFSLLVAYLAGASGMMGESANYLIQATTILTFIASTYYVGMRYPNPMALSDKLLRD